MTVFQVLVLLAAGALAGCSVQSHEDFATRPFDTTVQVDRNYQAVYADVLRANRACYMPGPNVTLSILPSSIETDAQLYTDLGYGEIYTYQAGTVLVPFYMVRIEREGAGTRLSVRNGPMPFGANLITDRAVRWAHGDLACQSPS